MCLRILLAASLCGGLWCGATVEGVASQSAQPRLAMTRQAEAESLYRQGVLQYEKGDLEAAIALYTQAIELNPHLAVAYIARAGAHGNLEDYDAAIADYSAAINLDDALASAYGGRGLARSLKGELDEGVNDLWTAAKLFRQQNQMSQYFQTLSIIENIAP